MSILFSYLLHTHIRCLIVLIIWNLSISVSIEAVMYAIAKCPLLPSSIDGILLDVTGGTTRRKGVTTLCVAHFYPPRHWGAS